MGKIIEINGYMVDIFMDCPAMFDYQRDPGRVTTVTTQFRPLPCCRHRWMAHAAIGNLETAFEDAW